MVSRFVQDFVFCGADVLLRRRRLQGFRGVLDRPGAPAGARRQFLRRWAYEDACEQRQTHETVTSQVQFRSRPNSACVIYPVVKFSLVFILTEGEAERRTLSPTGVAHLSQNVLLPLLLQEAQRVAVESCPSTKVKCIYTAEGMSCATRINPPLTCRGIREQ